MKSCKLKKKVRSLNFNCKSEPLTSNQNESISNLRRILAFLLSNESGAISIKQFVESLNLLFQLSTLVSICDTQSALIHFHNLRGTLDVCSTVDSVFRRSERLMLHQLKTT